METSGKIRSCVLFGCTKHLIERAIRLMDQHLLQIEGIWSPLKEASDYTLYGTRRISILPSDVQIIKSFILDKVCDFLVVNGNLEGVRNILNELTTEGITILHQESFWIVEELLDKEKQLRETNNLYREMQTILECVQEGIEVADEKGVIRYVNPAFARITGIAATDRVGESVFEVSPDGALAKVLQTGQRVIGWKNRVKNSNIEVISNGAPIYVGSKIRGAIVTFQDVTQIMSLQREIQEKNQKMTELQAYLRSVHEASYSFDDIIGESEAIQRALNLAKKAAVTNSPVLLTGESGTGKELFAHAIHNASSRKNNPFIVVNCAAIPETLLESELFGYEKGAFTNAVQAKPGKIEIANGGTFFMDEIGDMSPYLQAKLLRFLQSKQIERVG